MYMAVGAYGGDVNCLHDAGYARLYARSGTDWNMIQQINGTRSFDSLGLSLDLSHDGSMLIISKSFGPVYMYELSSSSFLYELVHTTNDISANEVSVSGDGMVVGVTSGFSSIGTRIFERIGDGFQQRGADISGYGRSSGIALNYNGSIAIVGDHRWGSNTVWNIGRAGVFQWRDVNEDGSMEWVQMGSDITGDADWDLLGDVGCVSITHDGLTVSVGAGGYDRSRGLVRVYNHDSISDTWKQIGIDLVGDNADDQFSKTSLSSDGTYLAVGTFGIGNYVRLFAKNGDNYEAVGETIISDGGRFGWSVDISADASALVVSSYTLDGNKGKVYLYDTFLSSSTPAPTSSSSLPPSLPESSVPAAFPTFSPSFVTAPPTISPSSSPSKVSPVNPTRDVTNPPSKQATNPPTLMLSTQTLKRKDKQNNTNICRNMSECKFISSRYFHFGVNSLCVFISKLLLLF